VLKNGRAKAVRFATLAALCEVLDCQPGDLLRWSRSQSSMSSLRGWGMCVDFTGSVASTCPGDTSDR
jgi:putative transcriptional regulator